MPGPDEFLKRADRALSAPACAIGAVLAKTRPRGPLDARPLVVRPGGMGDLIACQIAVEELGEDPASLLWLIEERSLAWARHAGLPAITYDGRLVPTLAHARGRHALVINTEQRFGLAQAMATAARARGGRSFVFRANVAARFATDAVPYDAFDDHETRAMRRLFATALDRPFDPSRPPRSRRHPSTGELLVAIAGLQSPSRDLGLDAWERHVRAFSAGRPFALAAAPVDAAFAAALAARFPGLAERHEGGFDALCRRVAGAERVLTVDGGPVHIASYYGVPARAIFTAGRHRKWAPLGEGSEVVRRELWCSPCTLYGQVPPTRQGYACRAVDEQRDARAPSWPGDGRAVRPSRTRT